MRVGLFRATGKAKTVPSIHFLAIWTVASQLVVQQQEALSRALLHAQRGDRNGEPPDLERLVTAALKLSDEDQAHLSDFLIGAIEAHYAGDERALLEFREATDDDSAAICALIADVFAEYPGCLFEMSEMPELVAPRTWFRNAGGRIWVAERDGEVLGVVAVAPSVAGFMELKKLYVAAKLRGTGAGSRLIALVENFARDRNAAGVHLWSDTRFELAHAVYEHKGYRRLPETRELHDVSNSIEYHFEKRFGR